ncbi:MAG: queuosine precursor transporter [Phycisphaerales bacterium JB043]
MSSHAPLPSEQHHYPGLEPLSERVLHARRERVFLVFAGIFLGSLAMLNILGITRFLNVAFFIEGSTEWRYKIAIAVGVLPYPITFLCTDFISELYGRRRANWVVFVGFLLNLWVLAVLWVGGIWPSAFPESDAESPFFAIRAFAFGAVAASMIAYLAAQFVDVYVFHFWKRLTRGRHLWLRNNGSTIVSQLVDTTSVILITYFFTDALRLSEDASVAWQLAVLIGAGYVFKLLVALVDTLPFYAGSYCLSRYLRLTPPHEFVRSGAAAVEAGVG